MFTFIKVFDNHSGTEYSNWFLKYHHTDGKLDGTVFNDNMKNVLFEKLVNAKTDFEAEDARMRLNIVSGTSIDYEEVSRKYNTTLLIRQVGSYMTLTDDHTITAIVQSTDWPTQNEGADIVICENDLNAEQGWIDYLQKKYPGQSINVLNNFRHRTLEDVRKHFTTAKRITFSTTFTSTDWFELLLQGMKGLVLNLFTQMFVMLEPVTEILTLLQTEATRTL